MLNLLVAILSESFEKINSNATFANYQERAKIICENAYLIPSSSKAKFCPKNKYLVVAAEVIEQDNETDAT